MIVTDRCPHCPLDNNLICRGPQVRRFCELVDPSRSDYDAAYIRILAGDDHTGPYEPDPNVKPSKGCCGGNPMALDDSSMVPPSTDSPDEVEHQPYQ